MVPTREVFWNIQYSEILYILAAVVVGILIYAIYWHYRRWCLGKPANRFNHLGKRTWNFIVLTVVEGFLHRRIFGAINGSGFRFIDKSVLPREFYPGLAHFLIFIGCIVFLIATFLESVSHYFFDFMHGDFYLAYSVVVDGFGILALIGVILVVIRRYVQRPNRLDNKWDDLVALLLIVIVIFTGFVVEGLRIAATELKSTPDWALWSPGGYVLALVFSGLNQGVLLTSHVVLWWLHLFVALGAVLYVSLYDNAKLFHIIWGPINAFFRNLGPRGALAPIDLEKAESFGAPKIEDFTWKQLVDLDACVRCGRCQDACPAYFSGKKLNPKQVIQDLKSHLYEVYPIPVSKKSIEPRRDMITRVVTEEVIWDCTTCRACQQACPVYVEHIDKIIDMRRNLVMERSQFPESAQDALKSLSTRWHPWRGTTATRSGWAEGLDVKVLAEDSNVDILYWVGCTAALDERNTKVAMATARILQTAGINFGILGDEEMCCGDPARRLGDEYLFQTLCQQNIEVLKSHNTKRIVTTCPHCFNTLKHEYPQFGGNYDVIHHTQFIAELIRQGRVKVTSNSKNVAYHDSCYLGRYNDIYHAPREILRAIGGGGVELPRSHSVSFCCGGGGGHMWMEEEPSKRVNTRRIREIIGTKVDTVTSACPYCLIMFEDGLKAEGVEGTLKARDLSELVAESLKKM